MKASRPSFRVPSAASICIVAGSLFGVFGATLAATSSTASKETVSVVFQEDFDDDPLGAVPVGVEVDGASPILNDFGMVEGSKVGIATLLNVVREDASDIGNCLAIGDIDPSDGGAFAAFVPSRGMVAVPLRISLDIRRECTSGLNGLYLCAIDNRTTPGTGRLLTCGFTGIEGAFEIGGVPQPFALKNGATYRIEIDLKLKAGSDDSWGITIKNLHDPFDKYSVKNLRTNLDGIELSSFLVSVASDSGLFAYVDNFEILQFLD